MTFDEARSHIGYGVVHKGRIGESAEYVIVAAAFGYVYIRSLWDNHGELVPPRELTLLSESEPVEPRDLMAPQPGSPERDRRSDSQDCAW